MLNITNECNMELMARYPDNYFELAIVDPPYGIDWMKQIENPNIKANWKKYNKKEWDNSIPTKKYFIELSRVSKNQIIWGGNYMTEYLEPSKGWIVWNKKADIKEYLSMAELAWSSFDKKCNMFDYLWAGFKKKHQVERIHPTQKPVDLYKWILEHYAKQGDKILDTHLGSGSIAIACHDYGFDLTACELDKEYFDKAMERINNHTAQQKLF